MECRKKASLVICLPAAGKAYSCIRAWGRCRRRTLRDPTRQNNPPDARQLTIYENVKLFLDILLPLVATLGPVSGCRGVGETISSVTMLTPDTFLFLLLLQATDREYTPIYHLRFV